MTVFDAHAFDWSHLTSDHAEILEAYFALFRERDPTTIGSGEIVRWFRDQQRTPPSESLIRTVLAAVDVPRRGGGSDHAPPAKPSLWVSPRPTTRGAARVVVTTVVGAAPSPLDPPGYTRSVAVGGALSVLVTVATSP